MLCLDGSSLESYVRVKLQVTHTRCPHQDPSSPLVVVVAAVIIVLIIVLIILTLVTFIIIILISRRPHPHSFQHPHRLSCR